MPARTGLAVATQAHVVQFYERDSDLARTVGSYLADVLRGGGAVIVVATPEHRQGFEWWMSKTGADLPSARSGGAYRAFDAAGLMERFVFSGRPDPAAFDAAVGTVLREVARPGRPVHIYGEMVALLWDAGQVNAALELEGLWNALREKISFSLLCGYRADAVAGSAHADALAEVCRLHTATLGRAPGIPVEAAAAFSAARDSPRAARRFLGETLHRWGAADGTEDAEIVVTELASNAVLHARSPFRVELALAAGSLWIRVVDSAPLHGPDGSSRLAPAPSHGLGVVAAIARGWGAEPVPGGKSVWAELPWDQHLAGW